jgi:hypothetical protein
MEQTEKSQDTWSIFIEQIFLQKSLIYPAYELKVLLGESQSFLRITKKKLSEDGAHRDK